MTNRMIVVDVYNGTPALIGDGPLPNVVSAAMTQELDRAGEIFFSVPATDARAQALLNTAVEVRFRTRNGQVAGGLIQTVNRAVSNGVPVYEFTGTDRLGELNYLTTGYNRRYDDQDVETVIIGATGTAHSLLAGTGWAAGTITIDDTVKTRTASFDGATRLAALLQLATEIGHHFREGATPRTLDFGLFGAASGYHLLNVRRMTAAAQVTAGIAFVGDIQQTQISADIENRLFPLGANKFDLRDVPSSFLDPPNPPVVIDDVYVRADEGLSGFATTLDDTAAAGQAVVPVTATTTGGREFRAGDEVWLGDADDWTATHEYGFILSVQAGVSITLTDNLANEYLTGTDAIQRPQFYIEDTTSQASYGVREACPQFSWIGYGGAATSAEAQAGFARQLYNAAKSRLTRYKDRYDAYAVPQILGLPWDLRVGQKIRLTYRGSVDDGGGVYFMDINTDLFVMRIDRVWSGDGTGGSAGLATLSLASTDRPTPLNTNLVLYNLDAARWVGLG